MGLKHQAASARKWRAAIRQVKRHFPADLPPMFFLTDPVRVPDPVSVAERLPVGAGIIYRHFGADDRTRVAMHLSDICRRRGLNLLIAADPGLAKRVGACGVHWPEARLRGARKWRGHFEIQTASAHSRRAIERAAQAGMDAALVSTVFASNSSSANALMGAIGFRRLSLQTRLPLYGLGGINANTASRIAISGGLAAIEGLS